MQSSLCEIFNHGLGVHSDLEAIRFSFFHHSLLCCKMNLYAATDLNQCNVHSRDLINALSNWLLVWLISAYKFIVLRFYLLHICWLFAENIIKSIISQDK